MSEQPNIYQRLLEAVHEHGWSVRSVSLPTGGDDYEVGWQVVEHFMAEPRERVIGEGMTPHEAIRAALTPERPGQEGGGA